MSTHRDAGAGCNARLLLDVRFQVRASRALLPALYLMVLVLVALAATFTVVMATVQVWWLGLVALLVVLPVALALAAAARIGCELVLAVLELNDYVEDIADRFPRIETVVGELARDMPKLGFLRRGAGTRERAAAATSASEAATGASESREIV